jgi:riboflavin synthase
MFTGLVQDIGRVTETTARRGSKRIGIASALPTSRMEVGESIAVDGVCLTATAFRGDRFYADVVAETLAHTTLGGLKPGSRVNLERALALGDRLGGHLVQGHVDATAKVVEIVKKGDDWRLRAELPSAIASYVALKGSIALNGVSLTVSALHNRRFEVALVPQTLRKTTLGDLRVGQSLNVEVDLLARYLERLMGGSGGPDSSSG